MPAVRSAQRPFREFFREAKGAKEVSYIESKTVRQHSNESLDGIDVAYAGGS
jgi:hypothetical protein